MATQLPLALPKLYRPARPQHLRDLHSTRSSRVRCLSSSSRTVTATSSPTRTSSAQCTKPIPNPHTASFTRSVGTSTNTRITPTTLHSRGLGYRQLHSAATWASAAAVLKRKYEETTPVPAAPEAQEVLARLPVSRVDERKVVIGFDTGEWTRFHHVWLRDHCRCSQCYHPVTKQRLFNTFDIPPDIKPAKVESKPTGLEVLWPSSVPHTSFYPWSWLKQHSYDPPLPQYQLPAPEKILWGSRIQQAPPTVTYEDVMAGDDSGLYKWLSNVEKFGFSFVTGVPPTPEATEELSTRIGFIRETQYGKFWDFTSDLAKGDTAYTTLALGAHTDNTYFTDPCGLQLFHLLSHTDGTGGQTLLVDGFYVASLLKELHPSAYEILSRVPVPAHAAGEPGCLYTALSYPVLSHAGRDGELSQVRWNNDDRSTMSHLAPGEVEEWYDAIRVWNKHLTSPDSEYWVQLSPGTAVVVDNHRVLHGRSAFDGKRRMCGAYIGVDEYKSKLAVLKEKFDPQLKGDTDASTDAGGRSVWSPYL